MSVSSSRVRRHVDFATPVVLFPLDGGVITATTLGTGISLDRLAASPVGTDAVVPHGLMSVAISVGAINLSTNSYSLELLTDSAATMDDDPAVLLSVPLTEVGVFETALDTSSVPSGHEYLAARVVIEDDDNPSIEVAAWLVASRAA